jgi:predicted methyltransferase
MYKSIQRIAASAILLAFVIPAAASEIIDHHGKAIKAAIENSNRPERDTVDDANRKPGEVLAFAGVAPGMTVLDVNSGGGYYSEIMSYIVGDEGKVYAHNGEVYWDFVKENVGPRYENRLSNVVQVNDSENVDVPAGSVDLAISILAYHDYFFLHPARNNEVADVDAALKSIYDAIKPGGAFVIVDHTAKPGTGEESGNTLHRIEPALVQARMEKAGFRLEKESDLLANPNDDLVISPFDASIRRKTHRFIHLYRK